MLTDDSDDELINGLQAGLVIMMADQVLYKGLELLGWEQKRLNRRQPLTNIDQYVGMFGVPPCVTAQLLEDLQTTTVEDAAIPSKEINIDKLHWSLHFLYWYPTETEQESTWNKCANTIRDGRGSRSRTTY
jgi:hypothetical protein